MQRKDEATFKEELRKDIMSRGCTNVFFIETEETEKGFPDMLCCFQSSEYLLVEVKVTDDAGYIEFERNQIQWYALHPGLNVQVAVLKNSTGETIEFSAYDILNKKSKYCALKNRRVKL